MKNSKKYWLNEFGLRYWYKNSNMSITACRLYHWVDKISLIEEGSVYWVEDKQIWTTSDRKHIGSISYTEFKKQKLLDDWTAIENFDDYAKKLKKYYEIRKYNLV